MPIGNDQIGPAVTGFMNNTGAGQGSCVVWVGNPPQGGFPNPTFEYWFMPGGFPTTAWSAAQGSGAGPTYASRQGSWLSCPNKTFGDAQGAFSVTIDANERIYDVVATINGVAVPGPSFVMMVQRDGGVLTMGWVATNLPLNQNYLYPEGTQTGMGLQFSPRASGTYSFAAGNRRAVSALVTA